MQLNNSITSLKLQAWHNLERDFDAMNHQSFIDMPKDHLTKAKIKDFKSAVKRWHKDTEKRLKVVSKLTFYTNKTFDYIRG